MAESIVRAQTNMLTGFDAQRRAIVMLKNRGHESRPSGGSATSFFPISGARYRDANSNNQRDAGEYINDTNGNGVIEIYYDGVADGLTMDANAPDPYEPFLGAYDYTTVASTDAEGAILPIVQVTDITKAEGKPEQAVPKIVEGRLGAWLKERVLIDQPYVKDDKQTIAQLLGGATIVRFAQVSIGA